MELLNRYLNAVAIRLPESQRADIESELRDALLSRFHERSVELGRVLSTKDVESLLRAYGNPLVVAARYRSHQQLITTDTYPYYMFALQIVLTAQLVAHIAWATLSLIFGDDPLTVLVRILSSLWIVSTYLLGVVTFSFVVLERTGAIRWLAIAWRPRYLPKVGATRRRIGRKLLIDCLMIGIPAAWAIGALHPSELTAHWPPSTLIRATSHWIALCWALVLVTSIQLIIHLLGALFPLWKRATAAVEVALAIGILGVLGALLRAKPWIAIVGPPPATADAVILELQVAVGMALGLIAVITVIRLCRQIVGSGWLRP